MLFMWTTLPAFGAASYVPQIVMERALFMRERADGLYNPVTYIVSKMFDEMLMLSGVSLVFAAMVFYAVQLSGSFLLFWLVYYFTLGNGVILAYLVSALSPNMEAANAILPTYVVTLLFFAGFLIRPADTPVYWQWYTHVDLMKYAWGALMINQWEDNDPIFLVWSFDILYQRIAGQCVYAAVHVPRGAPPSLHALAARAATSPESGNAFHMCETIETWPPNKESPFIVHIFYTPHPRAFDEADVTLPCPPRCSITCIASRPLG